jgi:H+-transporting ATPase
LFWIGQAGLHLVHPQIQTLMYLKLSVAGHLTILITRTRGPWWSIKPARILLAAIVGTQVFATLMAVYGLGIMTPIGWGWAGFVWGYAVIAALLTDPIKLLAYHLIDPVREPAKPEAPLASRPAAAPAAA